MTNPERPQPVSPLDRLGIVLTPREREEMLERLAQQAIEEAEDDQPASLPAYKYETPRFNVDTYQSPGPCCPEEEDEIVSGPLAARRSIINSELFWHGWFLDHDD